MWINTHGCCSREHAHRTLLCVEVRPVRFGDAVRRRRKTLGLTIAQLAERSGVSVNWISEVERGREPSLTTVMQIASALEVTPGELLDADRSKRSPNAAEAARLVEALPEELQAPLLEFLRLAAPKLGLKGRRHRA